jgi:hypothetical protein
MERNRFQRLRIGVLTVLVAAVGGQGYASASDDDVHDEDDIEELATVAGQALASIGGFSAGFFSRMHGEGDKSELEGCFDKSGDRDDNDEDMIPDDIRLELEDCPIESAFGIGTVSGTMHIRDADGDERNGAFEAELDLKIEATEQQPFDWSSSTTWLDGTIRGHGWESGASEAVISHDLHIRTDLERNGEEHTVESDTDWRVTFDPDEGWDVDERGVPGDIRIDGDWSFEIDGIDADAGVETLRPLRLGNVECQFGADEGELVAEFGPDDAEHELRVRWTGCNQGEVSVDVDDEGGDDE